MQQQQHSHNSSNHQHYLSQGQKKIEKYIFSMKKLIGKGSYANVYLGRSIQDNQQVAVKVIDKKIFANKYNLKNVQSEIDIMKKVDHPNIVKLFDVYQTNNNMYIVTEYCKGGDLNSYLKKYKKLKEFQAVNFLKEIVLGFQYLLKNGIVHRDLKPANLLLSTGNVCKISDFGFARNLQYGSQTVLNSIVGTPLYMSPQILKHASYSNKSDLWSVGLIFYQMMHGSTPWIASNELQLINNIYNKPLRFDHSISERSKDFIRKALKIKEEQRMSWEEACRHDVLFERIQRVQNQRTQSPRQYHGVYRKIQEKHQQKYQRQRQKQRMSDKENQPSNRNREKVNDIFRKLRLEENYEAETNKNKSRSPFDRSGCQNRNNYATPQNLTPKRNSSKENRSRSIKRSNPQPTQKSPILQTKVRQRDNENIILNIGGRTPKRFQRNANNSRHFDLTPERKSPWRYILQTKQDIQ